MSSQGHSKEKGYLSLKGSESCECASSVGHCEESTLAFLAIWCCLFEPRGWSVNHKSTTSSASPSCSILLQEDELPYLLLPGTAER